MDQYITLVKRQIAHYKDILERFPPGHSRHRPDLVEMNQRLVREHEDLLAYLIQQEDARANHRLPAQPSGQPPMDKSVAPDLSDLPPEILAELSDATTKGETDPVVAVINARGGTANLDEIIIDLYRTYHEINKRTILANKLYRLSKRGLVTIAPGKKGIYSTGVANPPDLFDGNQIARSQ